VAYDYRELIFRELMALNQEDPYYYSKRFRKALYILTKEEVTKLEKLVARFKSEVKLHHSPLPFIERKLQSSKGIKLRTETDIVVIPRHTILARLNEIDDWLDITMKKKAGEIRWASPGDLGRAQKSATFK
jgi:hypothetical protein